MKRVSHVLKQLQVGETAGAGGAPPPPPADDDDIVIVNCIRSAIGKAKKGSFKDTRAMDLLAPCLEYVTRDIDTSLIDDVCVGSVLPLSGLRATECRMACFLANYPSSVTVRTVNRQCSSGLQAIADIASSIQAGYIQVGVAAGVETMSHDSMNFKGFEVSDNVKSNMDALNCLLPMGITSENVVEKYGITREEQDECAAQSHARAAAAQSSGKFGQEILPIQTKIKSINSKNGNVEWQDIVVDKDDGIRAETTSEGLSKLRGVFKKGGTTTAGNSSQVSDGACALLLMKRSKAEALNLPIRARFRAFTVAGVDPAVMGIGPAFAIPKVLDQCGLSVHDIDLYEINEAFASQAVYCVRNLGLSWDKVNVNGGAIAFGHPLGCTGARMATTLIYEMERRGLQRGVVSMCIGSGMGAAAVFERV